ncbi:Outer membrane protein beta-barrel domain-containing protein [Hymenobacter daecheongensis DSM 21074]|uniref:Outer membrane protein beta-barrel domain-containing protein n=1 Tax=Hymenobacter daecheongensis DSM 21074 TaxID=1121955 RepID=A0A1M6AU20_9BACT|nr:porin family protein [Hymenobacter daecheongensis]SHI39911.1 Outer membrane protein beta-barrel domain-containing protein [Hymenobacter daecheongensis DSM 21074]
MKKIILAVALLLGAASTSQAQTDTAPRLGLKAGASVAILSGTINADPAFRTDFVAGPMLRLKPSRQGFTVQLEALISGQGANLETSTGTKAVKLYYLNVPLLLRQYIGGRFYVNVGPQLGVFLGSSTGAYKSVDGALVGGFGLETPGGLVVDLRANYGLSDINNDPAERAFREYFNLGGLQNRVIQASVGYLFGKK